MIKNLSGSQSLKESTDVLIIGAGTAGLIIANKLASSGVKVLVIESGNQNQTSDTHPFNEVEFTKNYYGGAEHGRFRCLGGTSTRWGGALIPFLASDIENAKWPISTEELFSYINELEELFKLNSGPYNFSNIEQFKDLNYLVRYAKWPPFKNRNIAHLLKQEIESNSLLTIYLNATATEFDLNNDLSLNTVKAHSPDGSNLLIKAKEIIIAAGAIESTRLLLLLEQQNIDKLKFPTKNLGHYFHDHLSTHVGNLKPQDLNAFAKLFGFRFEKNGNMRNMRFEMPDKSKARSNIPPHFVHIVFKDTNNSGFNALRNCFRYLQQRRIPPYQNFLELIYFSPWLIKAAWWRFIHKKLLPPKDAEIQVHIVMEQEQIPENKISLSKTRTDIFGKPLTTIEWGTTKNDFLNLIAALEYFRKSWENSHIGELIKFMGRPIKLIEEELASGSDVYHPCGSTRMSHIAEQGVVNSDLKHFRIKNLSIVSTSVLPNSGGANPTMMLLLLGLRCANHLSKIFKKNC